VADAPVGNTGGFWNVASIPYITFSISFANVPHWFLTLLVSGSYITEIPSCPHLNTTNTLSTWANSPLQFSVYLFLPRSFELVVPLNNNV
jgi:hypothetical protein